MRGHILGPAFRCLSGCWAQPSGLLRHTGFEAGRSAPERCDPGGCSPALTHLRQWIGWQAAFRLRFWPRMAERCADQDDLEHVVLRLWVDAKGRTLPQLWNVHDLCNGRSAFGIARLLGKAAVRPNPGACFHQYKKVCTYPPWFQSPRSDPHRVMP